MKKEVFKLDLISLKNKIQSSQIKLTDFYSKYFEYKKKLKNYNCFISERSEMEILKMVESVDTNSPLCGIPFVVKDNINTNYLPTTR